MFWTLRGAKAILALRANRLSGRFEQYWENLVRAANRHNDVAHPIKSGIYWCGLRVRRRMEYFRGTVTRTRSGIVIFSVCRSCHSEELLQTCFTEEIRAERAE
jgi:hypothetical protein